MSLEETLQPDDDLDVNEIVEHHFNHNGKGVRAWFTKKFSKHTIKSMEWMRDRKRPEDKNYLGYANYSAKWFTSYIVISWLLGDQRPTRQRQIAKAINLKRDYLLTTGNSIVGDGIELAHVYFFTGPVLNKAVSSTLRYFNQYEIADFLDNNSQDGFMIGYTAGYVIPRFLGSLILKKPMPGIGFKTLAFWIAIEGKKGMLESYNNTKQLIKNSYDFIFSRKQGNQYDQ